MYHQCRAPEWVVPEWAAALDRLAGSLAKHLWRESIPDELGRQISRDSLQTTLVEAASQGLLSLFNTLRTEFRDLVDINKRIPDPNGTGEEQTCLSLAARGGQSEIVRILVREYAIDLDVGWPLWWASRNGHKEVVETLLDSSAINVNEEYMASTPLGIAALRNHIDVMQTLLQYDAIDVNATCDGCGDDEVNGRTPLSLAISNRSLEAVRLMLAHPSVNMNAMDLNGHTPLSMVVRCQKEILRLLLEHKDINPTITDAYSRDALWHHAQAEKTLAAEMITKRLNAVTEETKAR